MADTYDIVVLGAGSAGENAADYAHRNGLTAVVVERELVGGECSYWACMPSKALLRPGEVLRAARSVKGAREAVTGDVDADAVLSLRDAFASHWDDSRQVEWLDGAGIDLVRGHGRITAERTVDVETDDGSTVTLTADRAVVIATGSRAAMPPIDGLADVEPWDSRDITTAKAVPERLLIIGGGVVGVEMAQAWARLGAAEVTVVEMDDRLLPREEPFVGDEVQAALEADGVTVRTGAALQSVRRSGQDGPVTATLAGDVEIVADEVVVATGRRANTDDIGLESVGLEPGGFVDVDEKLRVQGIDGDWLYAVGDVNGRALLTHQGKYQARIVGDVVAGRTLAAWADDRGAPRVVFTDPNVAAVGRTESQARDAGLDVGTVRVDVGHVSGGALHGKGTAGTCQLVIDRDRKVIVGATFVGPDVGELLHAATVAVIGEVPLERLWHAVPAFPTMSEVWLRLLEQERWEA